MEVSLSKDAIAAGAMSSVDLGGEKVTVAEADGSYYAFSDTCTHRGCSLAEGTLSGKELACMCHGARFDITSGEVLGGPARESLKTYVVSMGDGDITISGA